MYCKQCGKELDADANFCDVCGAKIENNLEADITNIDSVPIPGTADKEVSYKRQYPDSKPTAATSNNSYKKPKKSNTKSIIALLLVLFAVIIVYAIIPKSDKSSDSGSKNSKPSNNGGGPTYSSTTSATTEHSTTTAQAVDESASQGTTTTIIIYMIASNLESDCGCAGNDIQEIINANPSSKTNIIVEAGGTTDWINDFGVFEDGNVIRAKVDADGVTKLSSLGKKDMSEPSELGDFISYSVKNYPADRYVLVMWDHGGMVPLGLGFDENFHTEKNPNLMTTIEIGETLLDSDVHFQTIVYDACLMSSLESAICVRDCADYMVASEDSMNGDGQYYTNWVANIDASSSDNIDYLNIMCDDYLNISNPDPTATISCIKLDTVMDVYHAYKDYISLVYDSAITNQDYVNYFYARNNSKHFKDTDSVDIVSLAEHYPNAQSATLISAVEAASYYKNDMVYSGLTVYLPSSDGILSYSQGREVIEYLAYDQTILDFYDTSATILCAQNGISTASGESWYRDDYLSYVASTNIDPSELILTKNASGESIINIPANLVAIIDYAVDNVIYEVNVDGVSYEVNLGNDIVPADAYDDYDNILVGEKPYWLTDTYTDGPVTYYVFNYYDDGNSFYQFGLIPALVNDRVALLLYYMDEQNISGYVIGFCYCDNLASDFNPNDINNYYQLNSDDIVDYIYIRESDNGGEIIYWGNPTKASDLSLVYERLEDVGFKLKFHIYDVYGNSYTTTTLVYK